MITNFTKKIDHETYSQKPVIKQTQINTNRRRRRRRVQAKPQLTFISYHQNKMKLKSCFSSMDEDETDITKMETMTCCRHGNQIKPGKFSCPQTCSSVIDEYKQTRMSFIRERLDKTQISDAYAPMSSTSTDENEKKNGFDNRRRFTKKKKRVVETVSTSDEEVTGTTSSSYESRFEKSLEDIPGSGNGVEDDALLRRKEFRFGEVDLCKVNGDNRLTNLSTKSNSDSQLERTSDFLKNNLPSHNLEQTGLLHATSSVIKKETTGNNGRIQKFLEILKELIETERSYVASLRDIVEEYIPEIQRKDIVQGLRGQKFSVFCNIEKIYQFHSQIFLKDLEECIGDWKLIGKCFLKHEKTFDIYSLYSKNKPKSDELMSDYGSFFEEKRIALGHSLNLSSLLVKPVQRLARYSLLLDKLLKECDFGCEAYLEIVRAKEMIIYTLRHGDDLLVMDGIKNCDVNLNEQGKLLRQEEFLLIEENGKKVLKRRIFLFEELILFSIPSKLNSDEYSCCNCMKMTDVGLTDSGDLSKFIIWFRKYQFQKYTLQANSPEVKTAWVKEITNILLRQAEQYKLSKQAELAELGIQSQTRIPIQEEESDEDERTSNKQYYSMRSLRGVAGEIKPKKVIDRTTWYCTIRTDENEPAS